uniref:NADH-ubiquinone oxidoreductase chain 5 n=1 Tax=Zele chlorophthalmus TaxID=1080924 RepID=A0A345X0Q1_ZELCH|nr:NADH dehydrogenase subunit 5 [Zele chlorophthalmus]AXK15293.1 NADH dehydrogenase subunit 5 [Zele chlorophthalmus]
MQIILSLYLFIFSNINFFLGVVFIQLNKIILFKWNLLSIMSFSLEFIVLIDWMTLVFSSVVMMISSMVLIYSMEYMKMDMNINRFMILVAIFLLSMILMIFSPNMLSILLGWDGLGLSSFCLIMFYQNKKSMNSSLVTILMNRIGDINIILLISLLINNFTLNFLILKNVSNLILLLMIFASITKSAQIPFSTWLPMAMAAPTPVSALVHSSTLVTAGVYLIIRLSYLFDNHFMFLIMLISSFTMILSSTSALVEYDLKKIIALSTLSQLSLMMLTVSMGMNILGFFHLISHAMFKSLIFLCSGIMIHNNFNMQDIRPMNFTNKNLSLTLMIFNTAMVTLCGMPFLSGFYSKDLIIDFFNMFNMNFIIYNSLMICMMLTMLYSFRVIYYVTIKVPVMPMFSKNYINNKMNQSIYLLFINSVLYGSIMNWVMFNSINLIILPFSVKIIIYKLFIVSILISKNLMNKLSMKFMIINLMMFFNYMWVLPAIYQIYNIFVLNLSVKTDEVKNNGWLEVISSKKFLYLLKKLNELKSLNLNFLIMMTLSSYIMMIMVYLN